MEVIDKGLLEEMGPELNFKQWAADEGMHFWEGTLTTLRFSNSLGGLSEFSTAVVLAVIVCYSKMIQIKIYNRKSLYKAESRRVPGRSIQLFIPSGVIRTPLIPSHDINTYRVLPTREAYPCLAVQNIFCGWSHRQWLTACLADLSLQPF